MKLSVLSRGASVRTSARPNRALLFGALGLALVARRGTAQTFPTSAPTYACPDELSGVVACLTQNNLDAEACGACQFAYEDSITADTTCAGLNSLICNQLDACTSVCGSCGAQAELYLNCRWESQCVVSCGPSPTIPTAPNPAPAPSPASFPTPTSTTGTDCQGAIDTFSSCITATGGDVPSCDSCISANLASQVPCSDLATNICGVDEICPECGSCEVEHVAAINCLNDGTCDAFSCSPTPTASSPTPSPVASVTTAGPTPLPCPDEFEAFESCVESGGNSDACLSCLRDYVPDWNVTCSVGEDLACGAMDACPACGDCGSEYATVNICVNADTCPAYICPTPVTTSSPIATPSPTSASTLIPTTSPVAAGDPPSTDKCVSDLEGLQTCLAEEVAQSDASRCQACVTNAFNGLFPTADSRQATPTCSTINDELCAAVQNACDCGSCGDEYAQYLNCQVETLALGCELDCGGGGPSPVNGPSTSSSSRCRAAAGLTPLVVGMIAIAL